jgi:hypothetical protein
MTLTQTAGLDQESNSALTASFSFNTFAGGCNCCAAPTNRQQVVSSSRQSQINRTQMPCCTNIYSTRSEEPASDGEEQAIRDQESMIRYQESSSVVCSSYSELETSRSSSNASTTITKTSATPPVQRVLQRLPSNSELSDISAPTQSSHNTERTSVTDSSSSVGRSWLNKSKLLEVASPRLPSRCCSSNVNVGGTTTTPADRAAPPRQPLRTWDDDDDAELGNEKQWHQQRQQ